MHNKIYVVGILVPAAALLALAVYMLTQGAAFFALLPAALAASLIFVAIRTARHASFAPTPPPARLDNIGSPVLERWKKHHAEKVKE